MVRSHCRSMVRKAGRQEAHSRILHSRISHRDNLSSHISRQVIEMCETRNIQFVLLPPNTTHLTQPLDVSVYRPMKLRWRETVEEFKLQNPSSTSIDKAKFPSLLKSLLQKMKPTIEHTIRSGFETTGIAPFDPSHVLKKIPRRSDEAAVTRNVSNSLLE